LPPLGITQHPALWSSDFPPAGLDPAGDHLAYSAALGVQSSKFKVRRFAPNLEFS
jgi:hypothetical protein